MTYLALDAAEIVGTIERLQGRIEERFPGSGLGRVCGQLLEIARNARERAVWIAKPILPLRIASAALAVVIIAGLSLMVIRLRPPPGQFELGQFIQVLEAGINDVVLVGAAIFFLVTLESRIKRRRALRALRELRSIAHIIDMHQLTKDPERTSPAESELTVPLRRDAILGDSFSLPLDDSERQSLAFTGRLRRSACFDHALDD